jgi:hypothetical protein
MSSWKMEELQFLNSATDLTASSSQNTLDQHGKRTVDLSISVVDDLMSRGKLDELEKYIDESWVGWGEERA